MNKCTNSKCYLTDKNICCYDCNKVNNCLDKCIKIIEKTVKNKEECAYYKPQKQISLKQDKVINVNINNETTLFLRKDDLVEVVLKDKKNFTGKISAIESSLFYLDCSQKYSSDVQTIQYNEVADIKKIKEQ